MATVAAYALTSGATPIAVAGICLGPDGNAWAVGNQATNSYLWRITPTGVVTAFTLPASFTSSAAAASISADSTYIYVCSQNVSFGLRQYTTSGVLNGTYGAGTLSAQCSGGSSMIFDGTNQWVYGSGGGVISRVTPAGVITNFSLSTLPAAPWSMCYDIGTNAVFFSINSGSGPLIRTPLSAPTTWARYGTRPGGAGGDPQACSDGTYIWQCNDWQGLSKYLISAPATQTNYTWAGASLTGNLWYVSYDGTNLVTSVYYASAGNSFVYISPSAPTTAASVISPTSPSNPGPGSNSPLCIGASPAFLPWAGANAGSPLYAYTVTAAVSGKITMLMSG